MGRSLLVWNTSYQKKESARRKVLKESQDQTSYDISIVIVQIRSSRSYNLPELRILIHDNSSSSLRQGLNIPPWKSPGRGNPYSRTGRGEYPHIFPSHNRKLWLSCQECQGVGQSSRLKRYDEGVFRAVTLHHWSNIYEWVCGPTPILCFHHDKSTHDRRNTVANRNPLIMANSNTFEWNNLCIPNLC